MFSPLSGTYFSLKMHLEMSSAICFILDQCKFLSSLPNNKISDQSNLKDFADDKINDTYKKNLV